MIFGRGGNSGTWGHSQYMERAMGNAGPADYWWETLPAVPPSRFAHDWWARQTNGRSRPYERLRRVWADQTAPRDGLHTPGTERHRTVTLWENLALFHPQSWLPGLLATAGVAAQGAIADCCWSYEFEQSVTGQRACEKIADVVLHYRDAAGDGLLVLEAKNLGVDLSRSPKDRDPAYYLTLRDFAFIPQSRRTLVYLVDAACQERVARQIVPQTPWRYGIWTWQALSELQLRLAIQDLPPAVSPWIAALLQAQHAAQRLSSSNPLAPRLHLAPAATGLRLCLIRSDAPDADAPEAPWDIQWTHADPAIGGPNSTLAWSESSGLLPALAERHPDLPAPLRHFLAGAIQYQLRQQGISPPGPVFPYLRNEPGFREIWSRQPQAVEDRIQPLWKLPEA